jgi:UDP-N-acetylmuramate--alanine ligase
MRRIEEIPLVVDHTISCVHFIGIGGAGMSALARVLAQRGITVTGSDMKESRYSRDLQTMGVTVYIGHDSKQVGDADIVVYSTAISQKNPEFVEAVTRGIETWHRAQMLGYLAGDQLTVALAGTHGKTSTSSMVASMMRSMGLDPTFCIGGQLDGIDTNADHGSGRFYVVEADESDGSFLHLSPYIAVVTNIEKEHVDHYTDLDEIKDIFFRFMQSIDDSGTVIVCGDNTDLVEFAQRTGKKVVSYGSHEDCDVRFRIVGREGIGTRFELLIKGEPSREAVIQIPGRHMVSNATAALAVAYCAGLDMDAAAKGLSCFTGVRRRFDLVGETCGVTVVDDYAHHPTEISATLEAASSLDFERVIAVFQPHRYSRTAAFEREFGESFEGAYKAVILDVYSAGETPIPGVSGRTVTDSILDFDPRSQVVYLPHRKDIVRYLKTIVRSGDLVMTMGAGDVTAIGPELIRQLQADTES